MSTAKTRGKLRPLKLRKEARFTCFTDGLCCTDLHAIGPLSDKEVRFLKVFASEIIADHPEGKVFAHRPNDGACFFLDPDHRCQLHAQLGPEVKPRVCRQYPYHLVATPTGGRITTDHSCSCRTMGDRPPVVLEEVEPTFLDTAGRLRADRRVGEPLLLAPEEELSFADYEAMEEPMIEALLRGEAPEEVLEAQPFTALPPQGWIDIAEALLERLGWRRHDLICARVADTLLQRFGPREIRLTAVSWHDAFDRAQKRTPEPQDPKRMLGDWLADELWGLKWTYNFTFAHARADLVTRAQIARDIAAARTKEGAREDRAMAEAITCAEVIGYRTEWQKGMMKFDLSG